MDKDRQIRFLYPPLVFLGSLLLAAVRADTDFINGRLELIFFETKSGSSIIELLAISSLILLLGFLLGTLTVLLLRFFFWLFCKSSYEIKLSDSTYEKIGRLILTNKKGKIHPAFKHYAGMVFDHSYISQGMHSWIIRRWNSFFIASSSTVSLFASIIFGLWVLNIPCTLSWAITVFISMVLFTIQAIFSWKQTMKMITFLTKVKKEKDKSLEAETDSEDYLPNDTKSEK
jgi:hypothetical protein